MFWESKIQDPDPRIFTLSALIFLKLEEQQQYDVPSLVPRE